MKFLDAVLLSNGWLSRQQFPGYRVSFEKREGSVLASDFFPATSEIPFRSEDEALSSAKIFAGHAPVNYVNIHVIGSHFRPIGEIVFRKVEK